jgi:hypothetical protein
MQPALQHLVPEDVENVTEAPLAIDSMPPVEAEPEFTIKPKRDKKSKRNGSRSVSGTATPVADRSSGNIQDITKTEMQPADRSSGSIQDITKTEMQPALQHLVPEDVENVTEAPLAIDSMPPVEAEPEFTIKPKRDKER